LEGKPARPEQVCADEHATDCCQALASKRALCGTFAPSVPINTCSLKPNSMVISVLNHWHSLIDAQTHRCVPPRQPNTNERVRRAACRVQYHASICFKLLTKTHNSHSANAISDSAIMIACMHSGRHNPTPPVKVMSDHECPSVSQHTR